MSDYEQHHGTLQEVHPEIADQEEKCRLICEEHGWEKDDDITYAEVVREESDDGAEHEYFVYRDSKVFKFLKHEESDCFEVYKASVNQDQSIDFTCLFHNGGCGLEEALEEALDKVLKPKSAG